MGERELNHIATGTSRQPRGRLLTHGHGDEELDGEVDEEVQPGVEMEPRSSHGTATVVAARGGGCPWRRGGGCPWRRLRGAATALGGSGPWPLFFLGDGGGMEEVLHPQTAAWKEENSWYGAPPTT